MSRTEIMVGGVGGQGVVLTGILLGTAATLFENKKAVQTQSYSSELRGGSARAEEALPGHISRVKPGGLVIVDSDRAKGVAPGDYEIVQVSATSIAEKEMGDVIVANLIILGALIRRNPVVSAQSMEQAIEATVPPKARGLNLAAFRRGLGMDV